MKGGGTAATGGGMQMECAAGFVGGAGGVVRRMSTGCPPRRWSLARDNTPVHVAGPASVSSKGSLKTEVIHASDCGGKTASRKWAERGGHQARSGRKRRGVQARSCRRTLGPVVLQTTSRSSLPLGRRVGSRIGSSTLGKLMERSRQGCGVVFGPCRIVAVTLAVSTKAVIVGRPRVGPR